MLVTGAGKVATRRLERYLESGARVDVVALDASARVRELDERGELHWEQRAARAEDVEGAWFVLAATDSPAANALVAAACEQRHIFCVRADDADGGTARTTTYLAVDGFSLGIIGHRDPRGARALRRRIAAALGLEPPA